MKKPTKKDKLELIRSRLNALYDSTTEVNIELFWILSAIADLAKTK
jgi:hypothetical protein